MSVINQMLKDLDERKTASPNGAYAAMNLTTKNHAKLPWVIVAILSLALIVWALKDYLPVSTLSQSDKVGAKPETETYQKPANISDSSEKKSADNGSIAKSNDLIVSETGAAKGPANSLNEVATNRTAQEPQNPSELVVADQSADNAVKMVDELISAKSIELPSVEAAKITNNAVSQISSSEPRVVKVSPQQELRDRAQMLYEQYQRSSFDHLSDSQYSEILALDPDYHQVRISWLGKLSQQKDSRFEQQAMQAVQGWPEIYQYRQMLARFWVMAEPQRAYKLLMQKPPTISQAPDYHGLIAYSAKQMGDLNLASKQYQLLLKSYPERADWWLALALAEDQLRRSASALRAYQQSLRFPGLAQNTQAYAEQRIKALQGF